MKVQFCYYLILTVYIILFSCQLVACHLTHSLIILTDSYINLYRIFDVSLGILHLKTREFYKCTRPNSDQSVKEKRLFGHQCTYNFRRLPVLGSFINGLFLAALLMSVIIEGLQTCLHFSHAIGADDESILRNNPIIYPALLLSFALIGSLMQFCAARAHESRERQLDSESLDDISPNNRVNEKIQSPTKELDVVNLEEKTNSSKWISKQQTNTIKELSTSKLPVRPAERKSIFKESKSFESLPISSNDGSPTRISLQSFKMTGEFEGTSIVCMNSLVVGNPESIADSSKLRESEREDFWWLLVRCCVSPGALMACAIVNSLNDNETILEYADASCAILVVTLLYIASIPPMKRAGKVLMQTAPEQVDVERLRASLSSLSDAVVGVKELYVWSLTKRSNRVGTCHLLINKHRVESERQLADLINEAKFKFLDQNIKCSAIQPVFVE